MSALPVIAIFDIGRTNKKLFLFDENYKIVFKKSVRITETIDEDGDPCENIDSLCLFIFDSLRKLFQRKDFQIKAINFSAYGASFVYIDESGKTIFPLYNYLKEYPEYLKRKFYTNYEGEDEFSCRTASPVLGSLNSGMQLYRIKYEKPQLFKKIKYALHLPQYLSFLLTGKVYSDITSIGCHTNLWDFTKNDYHYWVGQEGIFEKLPPVFPSGTVVQSLFEGNNLAVGIGLHDSSAALIPYLINFNEPFILISTGTWSISLNPFNESPLTKDELKNDCLYYLTYEGKPVKASRLFAGHVHEEGLEKINKHFHKTSNHYKTVAYNPGIITALQLKDRSGDLNDFNDYEKAYHQLVLDIVEQQYKSTQFVLKSSGVKRIFVDGGFSENSIYMNLLASFFTGIEVYAATISQATAIGAALSIHKAWNQKVIPNDLIELKYFSSVHYSTK